MWLLELIVQFFSEAFETNSWTKALFRLVVVPIVVAGVGLGLYLLVSK